MQGYGLEFVNFAERGNNLFEWLNKWTCNVIFPEDILSAMGKWIFRMAALGGQGIWYMGGCQNYVPFLGTLFVRCRITIGIQKGTIILTTAHMWKCDVRKSIDLFHKRQACKLIGY